MCFQLWISITPGSANLIWIVCYLWIYSAEDVSFCICTPSRRWRNCKWNMGIWLMLWLLVLKIHPQKDLKPSLSPSISSSISNPRRDKYSIKSLQILVIHWKYVCFKLSHTNFCIESPFTNFKMAAICYFLKKNYLLYLSYKYGHTAYQMKGY